MQLPNSGLENHPSGTGSLNAIVNGNWNAINNWISPAYGKTASRAGTTVTASAAIFTDEHVGDKLRFLVSGQEVTIVSTAGTVSVPSTTCVVSAGGTVASQAFDIFAAVTESPMTAFARGLLKKTKAADITNGQTFIWSTALQRFVNSAPGAADDTVYLNTEDGLCVNTAAETSIIGRPAASTPIVASTVADNSMLLFELEGTFEVNGATPTILFRVKLGGTTYGITSAVSLGGALSARPFRLKGSIKLTGSLATMTARVQGIIDICADPSGTPKQIQINATNTGTTIDMTADREFDVTADWSAANANNAIRVYSMLLKKHVNAN